MSPPTSAIISPTGTYKIASSAREDENQVRQWGFSHVFTWSDPPHAHYPPHSHSGLTTHLIRRGELTITYPEDGDGKKETYGVGARLDVPAGKLHEVWMGSSGCSYVIGE
ncbi:hypothetical protein H2198_001334 [Neophaeococcomyces mojaviensis]|uniref:Uncharacterized protein n=1 Tax=Neophaeococcomyces mojaviensis TaxID=3383035 RepID=A0ACC3AH66_9EURO|nr:hypothetical protein H2198_001334 [Knufia sp. JES_112]